jgi:tRNA-splicing ligase RtcB (3'-phosphate/5'-hydroxy nucleic acid ligase)
MGTRSYVVTGKGSRVAQLDAAMEGIEWRRASAFLDEIPAACKDIDVIMEDAKDLAEIRHTLRQIVNVKGD